MYNSITAGWLCYLARCGRHDHGSRGEGCFGLFNSSEGWRLPDRSTSTCYVYPVVWYFSVGRSSSDGA
ncbi:hypothetical protein PVL29_017933 [Vitis rotundifolia]|uniref:Uncharacterized protein n=1 Tax=Vitis rotundifolia TaxID=103349 RepID=A0AA38Z3M5_VITRO|nr:hypothetical protein PVL29_017933 [Vitis rotundifolia]